MRKNLDGTAINGVEVHGARDNRLVVTIEAETVDESHDIASSFISISGVYGINLVYANFEDDPTLARAQGRAIEGRTDPQ